jgi:hypothetical protein
LHVAAFTDFASGDKSKIQRLKENALLRDNHVFTAADLTGQIEADLEDVLGWDFYVALVNKCYQLKGKNLVTVKKPASGVIRVVKAVEDCFRTLPTSVDEFDHFKPCAFLLSNADTLRGILPDESDALNRFEKLVMDLNALL